jgi:hypothetical protein
MTGFGQFTSQSDYPGAIFTPAETAVSSHDEVIQLLIAVGADVNQGIKRSLMSPRLIEGFTLLDSVRSSIATLSDLVVEAQNRDIDSPALAARALGWNGYRDYLKKTIRLVQAKKQPISSTNEAESLRNLHEMKTYFMNVEDLLVSCQAKSWTDIYPDDVPANAHNASRMLRRTNQDENDGGYALLGATYYREFVPKHMVRLYNDLFDACFFGNNEKIQQLCLPLDGAQSPQHPLQIAVVALDQDNLWNGMSIFFFVLAGTFRLIFVLDYTPLFAAISGRHWSTAKLIVAISAAQYAPDAEDKFNTSHLSLGGLIFPTDH